MIPLPIYSLSLSVIRRLKLIAESSRISSFGSEIFREGVANRIDEKHRLKSENIEALLVDQRILSVVQELYKRGKSGKRKVVAIEIK